MSICCRDILTVLNDHHPILFEKSYRYTTDFGRTICERVPSLVKKIAIGIGLGSIGAAVAGQRGALCVRGLTLFTMMASALTGGVFGGIIQRGLPDIDPAVVGEAAAAAVVTNLMVAGGAMLVDTGFYMALNNSEGLSPSYPQLAVTAAMIAIQTALHVYNNQTKRNQDQAMAAFIYAIIQNDLSTLQGLPPDAFRQTVSNYACCLPEGFERFCNVMVEQMIRSRVLATNQNTPDFLHGYLNQINGLQIGFQNLAPEDRDRFSDRPLPNHASAELQVIHGNANLLAGDLLLTTSQVTNQIAQHWPLISE